MSFIIQSQDLWVLKCGNSLESLMASRFVLSMTSRHWVQFCGLCKAGRLRIGNIQSNWLCKNLSLAPADLELMILPCGEEVNNKGANIQEPSLTHLYSSAQVGSYNILQPNLIIYMSSLLQYVYSHSQILVQCKKKHHKDKKAEVNIIGNHLGGSLLHL